MQYANVSTTPNGTNIEIHGDGATTAFKVNLNKPPFDLDFGGNLPIAILVQGPDQEVTGAVANETDGDMLTLDFSDPPDADGLNVSVIFSYGSL